MARRNARNELLRRISLVLAAAALALTASASVLAEEPQKSTEAFDFAAMPLRAAVWLDRGEDEIYAKGDRQTVTFQANEDAYAVVYRIDTEGLVTVLWPRTRMDDGFVFGGHEYVVPIRGGPRLTVAGQEGEGFVEVIVSRYPFDLRALDVDFHHEQGGKIRDFRVVGDPFLAMNEVNFAVTGLDDAEDYVVTNYASYFVHRKVDHPRYLCGQCHFDDGLAYDPYRDSCRLNITVDYRWSNGWWGRYGYYPVYSYPTYVYVDPWTWRPWVNFWYDPWWSCPTVSVCWWPDPWYTWHDHPHYRGDCYTGPARHRPLTPGAPAASTRTKTREFGAISPLVAAKSAARDVRAGDVRAGTSYTGEARAPRTQPVIADQGRTRSAGGLRIRPEGSTNVRGVDDGNARLRHTAAGTTNRGALAPATGSGRVDARRAPSGETGARSGATVRSPRTGTDSPTIRTVEPRQRGTRIWNTGRSSTGEARRTERVRSDDVGGSRGTRTEPRNTRDQGGTVRRDDGGRTRNEAVKGGSSRDDGAVRSGSTTRSGGAAKSGTTGGGSRGGTRSGTKENGGRSRG